MNTRKRITGGSVTVLLSVFLALAVAAPLQAGEHEDYQAARNQNTIDGWESYFKRYPKGENLKASREAYDKLLWLEAEKTADSPTALESIFIRKQEIGSRG